MSAPLPYSEWVAEGERLFGTDKRVWRFKCPSCGHVATPADWKTAGAPEGAVAFACVGRWLGARNEETFNQSGGPCTYTGGGLFKLNPVVVKDMDGNDHSLFAFAEASSCP